MNYLLVMDIGNTNIKVGVFDGDNLVDSLRLATSSHKTSDEYWRLLKGMLVEKNIKPEDVTNVVISSVNPNLNYTIEHLVSYYFKVTPIVVGRGTKCGLNIKYDNPKEVGADRIVSSTAAYSLYGGPVIVVDCGTATTFNVVNAAGEFLGGAISFGLKSAADALSQTAARLPKIELTITPTAINKSTITNMQSGIMFGYIGMVEYIIGKIKSEIGQAKVVATGGISEIIKNNSKVIDIFDRTLTLRGLNLIFKLNKNLAN